MTDFAAAGHQCPACAEPVGRHDRFCELCGQNLLVHRTPLGGAGQAFAASKTCASCEHAGIDADGFCERCGRAQPHARDRMECDLGIVAGVSDRGRRRPRNEDSMAFGWIGRQAAPRGVVAVVCDGVASSERAADASQLAADAAVGVLLTAMQNGADPDVATTAAAAAAGAAVTALAGKDDPSTAPASTYVSAIIAEDEVTIGWIGDSRAYWLAANPGSGTPSYCLTTDHTRANDLVAAGVNEASANADSDAAALSRWLGADAEDARPQIVTVRPQGPGIVVLCSDGLWGHLPSAAEQAAHLPAGGERSGPFTLASQLTAAALEQGGHDNIAVVAVPFPVAGAPSSALASVVRSQPA